MEGLYFSEKLCSKECFLLWDLLGINGIDVDIVATYLLWTKGIMQVYLAFIVIESINLLPLMLGLIIFVQFQALFIVGYQIE